MYRFVRTTDCQSKDTGLFNVISSLGQVHSPQVTRVHSANLGQVHSLQVTRVCSINLGQVHSPQVNPVHSSCMSGHLV